MSKNWQAYAFHILDCIEKIAHILERGDISEDAILYDALLRNLQTLSEATQRLPEEIKNNYTAIPWRNIADFRNILVHNYLGDIDSLTIKQIVDTQLPLLKIAVLDMLNS